MDRQYYANCCIVLVKISCVAGDFRSKTIIDAAEKSPTSGPSTVTTPKVFDYRELLL
jgi:hypothetical protein